jgi:hypothetical protein
VAQPEITSSQTVALLARPASSEESPAEDDLSERELRAVVERSWSRLCSIADRTLASGRFVDRTVLVELARWLDGAGTAVRAYERLVVRLRDQALHQAEVERLATLRPVPERGTRP